jgi:ketosteroid isomerase-like protein
MNSDITETIRAIYDHWNANNREGVIAAFEALGPKGFTVEYVGNAPLEGRAAVEDMWTQYAGKCTTEIVQLIVNGNEAAALIHNNLKADGGIVTLPSIETYKLRDGMLEVRYFHRTAE